MAEEKPSGFEPGATTKGGPEIENEDMPLLESGEYEPSITTKGNEKQNQKNNYNSNIHNIFTGSNLQNKFNGRRLAGEYQKNDSGII